LQKEFPKGTGLSLRNLKYARQWFSFYYQQLTIRQHSVAQLPTMAATAIGQQSVAQFEMPDIFAEIGWSHHIIIMSKAKDLNEALFYIHKTIDEGLGA
jgi:predicted nuclease of restriction endonuclease-like (RecB) superfamily